MMNKINKSIFIKNLIFAVATTTLATTMFAQNTDTIEYFSNKTLRYEDHTYVKNLRTIQLSPEPNALTPPLILLNSEEKLLLNFVPGIIIVFEKLVTLFVISNIS